MHFQVLLVLLAFYLYLHHYRVNKLCRVFELVRGGSSISNLVAKHSFRESKVLMQNFELLKSK